MIENFKRIEKYPLLDTSKYPPEVRGRFNSFITTQFDDSLSVEMQMRSIIKWAIENFELVDKKYESFTDFLIEDNLNPFIEFINDLVDYMNNFFEELEIKINSVIAETVKEVITERIKTVWFGLTDDGHFMAVIPKSWKEITFDTSEDGHLILIN